MSFEVRRPRVLGVDNLLIRVADSPGSGFNFNLQQSNPLGGVRNANPNFQYYPAPDTLPSVVDGSFQLNGETISVSAELFAVTSQALTNVGRSLGHTGSFVDTYL